MVTIIKNPFNYDEQLMIDEIIKNFVVIDSIGPQKGYYNQYHKQNIDLPNEIKLKITESIKEIVDYEPKIIYTRVNWVTVDSNTKDPYHNDFGYESIFTSYHGEFEGGEFEWIEEGEIKKIKPENNECLIVIDNPQHKILNVTKGNRYAIVTFCKKENKII
jgi:hypothetical protein